MDPGSGCTERRPAITQDMILFIRSTLFIRTMTATVIVLALGACADSIIVSEVQPDGSLAIMGPGSRFAEDFESGRWITSGDLAPGMLVITEKQGKRALLIPPGDQAFTILNPIDANLLSTPYLGWSWLLEQGSGSAEYHAVSLLVGFYAPPEMGKTPSFTNMPDAVDETPANRAFGIRWAVSALQRGDMSSFGDQDVPFYIVRGGRENLGRWWQENVDLAALYTRLWPGEDPLKTHIVFVAITVGTGRANAPAYLADMRLFR